MTVWATQWVWPCPRWWWQGGPRITHAEETAAPLPSELVWLTHLVFLRAGPGHGLSFSGLDQESGARIPPRGSTPPPSPSLCPWACLFTYWPFADFTSIISSCHEAPLLSLDVGMITEHLPPQHGNLHSGRTGPASERPTVEKKGKCTFVPHGDHFCLALPFRATRLEPVGTSIRPFDFLCNVSWHVLPKDGCWSGRRKALALGRTKWGIKARG